MQIGVQHREGESLLENIMLEAMHDILESDDIEKVFDDCEKRPACLLGVNINNDIAPSF